jgi:TPR repeat protein
MRRHRIHLILSVALLLLISLFPVFRFTRKYRSIFRRKSSATKSKSHPQQRHSLSARFRLDEGLGSREANLQLQAAGVKTVICLAKVFLIHVLLTSHAVAEFAGIPDDVLRQRDDLPALVELAARQLYGASVEMDQAFILETFRKGSEAGIPRAHTGLADCHLLGVATERDFARTIPLYQLAEKGGDPLGTLRLGENTLMGQGIPRDPARGIELIRKASGLGMKNADAVLALRTLLGEGLPPDRDAGLRRLHELAEQDGTALAAFFLGQFYRGDFAKDDHDLAKAVRFFEIGAEKNHAASMVALGDFEKKSKKGSGQTDPKVAAADWYRRAVRRNSGDAMFKLAKMQQSNTKMRAKDEDWYQMLLDADRVGNIMATQYLGELHYHANGYTYRDLDWTKSAYYHHKYLNNDQDTSQRHISLNHLMEIYFEGGFGLKRDYGRCMEIAQDRVSSWSPAGYYAGRILLHAEAPMGATREHFIRGYACLLKSKTLEKSPVTDEILFILRSRHGLTREEVARAEELVRDGFPNRNLPILP